MGVRWKWTWFPGGPGSSYRLKQSGKVPIKAGRTLKSLVQIEGRFAPTATASAPLEFRIRVLFLS